MMRMILPVCCLLMCALLAACTVSVDSVSPREGLSLAARGTEQVGESPAVTQTALPAEGTADTPVPAQATAPEASFEFTTYDVSEKYYSDAGSYLELLLTLPKLYGDYAGIPEINAYFSGKEALFYDELPFDSMEAAEEEGAKIEGVESGYYVSAEYCLSHKSGNIISISAFLDGGAGGANWIGIEGNTFDLSTGKKLSLADLFKMDEPGCLEFIYGFVSETVMEDIRKKQELDQETSFFFDDAYTGDGYEMIREFDPDDFYLTENALVVFYQKYALAAGAAGPQLFELPYTAIQDMLAINVYAP